MLKIVFKAVPESLEGVLNATLGRLREHLPAWLRLLEVEYVSIDPVEGQKTLATTETRVKYHYAAIALYPGILEEPYEIVEATLYHEVGHLISAKVWEHNQTIFTALKTLIDSEAGVTLLALLDTEARERMEEMADDFAYVLRGEVNASNRAER